MEIRREGGKSSVRGQTNTNGLPTKIRISPQKNPQSSHLQSIYSLFGLVILAYFPEHLKIRKLVRVSGEITDGSRKRQTQHEKRNGHKVTKEDLRPLSHGNCQFQGMSPYRPVITLRCHYIVSEYNYCYLDLQSSVIKKHDTIVLFKNVDKNVEIFNN